MTGTEYLLGLNFLGHDASASLLKDGEVIASAMEERFTRVKKDRSFPEKAIAFCLKKAGVTVQDLSVITFYVNPELLFQARVIDYLGKNYPESVPLFRSNLDMAMRVNKVEKEIRDRLGFFKEIYFCDHHLGHIALAAYTSPYDKCAVISADGIGEIHSLVTADVEGTKIRVLDTVEFPHSLGMLYSAVTHFCGFNAVSNAGKTMGLSAYGDPETYIREFRRIVTLDEDGTFRLDLNFFEYQRRRDVWISSKFTDVFGKPRKEDDPIERRHEDVAAACQKRVEEVYVHMAKHLKKKTGKEYLCLAGGVALNSVSNGNLVREGIFKDVYVPPPTGDDGLSIGAPLHYHHCVKGKARRSFLPFSPYLGTDYQDEEIVKVLKKFNLPFRRSEDVCQETANLLSKSKIVGWFQGRMEIGPRALGNRSIVANSTDPKVKEKLNARVKFREPFRPFAPSILEGSVKDWFDVDHPSPYMLHVFDIKEEKRNIIPGVTHVDGSGRLQSVSKELNPKYYRLIDEFRKITGVPIIVNTSFNIRGEPIVESPTDAIRCFLGNGIDYLVLNDFIIEKDY